MRTWSNRTTSARKTPAPGPWATAAPPAVPAARNTIAGNKIGTDWTGMYPLENDAEGVNVSGSFNVIGGTTSGAENLISANGGNGVGIWSTGPGLAQSNLVEGNLIGTDAN